MRPGEIRWVALPPTSGHEQMGRRPAVIVQDDEVDQTLPLSLVMPLTSQIEAAKMTGTVVVAPSPSNGLRLPSVVLVFQMRALDRRLIGPPIGKVDSTCLEECFQTLDRLMGRIAEPIR